MSTFERQAAEGGWAVVFRARCSFWAEALTEINTDTPPTDDSPLIVRLLPV